MGKLSNFLNKFSKKESNASPTSLQTLDESAPLDATTESISPNSVPAQTLSTSPPSSDSLIQTSQVTDTSQSTLITPTQPAPQINSTPATTTNLPSPLMAPTASSLPTINQPQLFQITTQMLRIPLLSELGTNLQNFIYDASLTQEKITPYINHFQSLISAEQVKLAKLRDPSDVLTEYITHATFLSRQTTSTEAHTYETFLSSTDVDLMKKEAVVLTTLKQLIPHLFDASADFDFNEFLRKYAIVIAQINDVTPKLESFIASADSLRNDIVAFTSTINQYQNNKMLAVDWNSKKGALANTRAALEQRRNAFLTDEITFNNALAQVSSQFQPIHSLFSNIIPQVIPHLETMHKNLVPDQQLTLQRTQIDQTLKTIMPLYEELKTYILGLQN